MDLQAPAPPGLATVDLGNCDQEPIHLIGSVQPHGVLIALDLDGRLTHASRNAEALLPLLLPPLGERLSGSALWRSQPLRDAAEQLLGDAARGASDAPLSIEAHIGGDPHDIVLHANAGRIVIEFERRAADSDTLASFAMLAHRSMVRLKGRTDIDAILREAVAAVRRLTGFDRVMAYCFHADDSGEIVAEARDETLRPYLGRRFPASDIPVQARRLYVVNTLRLIADVNDRQVPIAGLDPAAPPLDLSYSILRSVSPIHIEYLKNINVAASMSVSIVVGGRLWGLLACHHRRAHRVPYAVRMACDVLANIVASAVQVALERAAAARRATADELRSRLAELALHGDDLAAGLGPTRDALASVIPCDRVLFAHGSKLRHDDLPGEAAGELLRWLDPQAGDLIALNELSTLPEPLPALLAPVCGVLALRHDRVNRGWVVLLRHEQRASVTWSAPPDKAVRIGPLGARLTPDGSLAEWRQEVLGQAEPWNELDLAIARQLLDELLRASAARAAEMDVARSHLLAILGHDLRDPLQSINMAALLVQRGGVQASAAANRISASSGRMGRLIAQVMDMSRLHGGLGLGLRFATTDLSALIEDLVEEARLAYPNTAIRTEVAPSIEAEIDPDRFAQVVSNLLGNARQHGRLGDAVVVRLRGSEERAVLEVANRAAPIPDPLVAGLFDPLKRGSLANQRNPGGLGLGLFIASEVAKAHHGSLAYAHDGEHVVFTFDIPQRQ